MTALEDRAVGAYLGLAVGDALGATVEFMTPAEIRTTHGTHREIVGGGWLSLKRGQVTDDTGMSLALGEAILAEGGRVEPVTVAEAFSTWMASKPVDIGHTVRRGLGLYRRTGATEVPVNDWDAGNGACMRCLPVALATFGADEARVRAACRIQAHVTHNAPLSDAGTEAVVNLVQMALRGATLSHLEKAARAFARAQPEFRFDRKPTENPSAFIAHTLRVVFEALFAWDDFESALVEAVNRGGDADTTGAILGMIAGALYGRGAIPGRWLRRLDGTIRRACETQALALIRLAPAAP